MTSSRSLLLRALFDQPRDRTAEELAYEIHRIAPDINMSTVYRNLDELERLGMVVHAHLGYGPTVYNLAALAHGHLVGEICAAVIETPAELFDSLARAAVPGTPSTSTRVISRCSTAVRTVVASSEVARRVRFKADPRAAATQGAS